MGSQDWDQGQPCFDQSHPDSIGLDAKKKTIRASEQDDLARAAWREQAKQLSTQDLVIVDETGTQINMTPLYAYAPRGERAVGKVPRNYGANLTDDPRPCYLRVWAKPCCWTARRMLRPSRPTSSRS